MALWVDDQLSFAATTVAAGNAAMGAWVRLSAWSSAQLADGVVPHAIAGAMASSRELAQLIAVGLLAEDADSYRILGYLDLNPTRDQVTAERATRRASAQAAARARWGGREPDARTHPSPHATGMRAPMRDASVDAGNTQSPLPIPSLPSQKKTSALTGSPSRSDSRARKQTKHSDSDIAAKTAVVEAFASAFEAAKGCRPDLSHQADHAAAFALAAKYGADEASAIVRRALSDQWVLDHAPTLRHIASKPDAWRGNRQHSRNGHQPDPPEGRAWELDDGASASAGAAPEGRLS